MCAARSSGSGLAVMQPINLGSGEDPILTLIVATLFRGSGGLSSATTASPSVGQSIDMSTSMSVAG
jgi:hypothetical protein